MQVKAKEYENDNELLYMIGEDEDLASDLIYKKYKPVIDHYVQKYILLVEGKGMDYSDLYQEGLIGLDKAIKGYMDQKDIKFSTFAFMCIERNIITAIRNANRQKHKVLNESYSYDFKPEDDNSYENILTKDSGGIEDKLVSIENNIYFNKRVKEVLSEKELDVYNLKLSGNSYAEIAKKTGKTVKSIDSMIFRIRIKLKKVLDEIND